MYTAISRKVVGQINQTKCARFNRERLSMGYDQYTVPDTVAVEPNFVAFL